jgi:ElaB/YqjD/DUF883 family membrane-anchored ribosome-binding protein
MVKSRIDDAVNTVERNIGNHAASLGKLATAMSESAASAVQDAVQTTAARASDIGGRLYDEGRRARRSFGRFVAEEPVATVLVAAAFGYGAAYLLHRRR